ncbi:MAG TPA: HEAT repeat domain-containing protein [Phycisphaerae bacterium]|nr:HEAT repeat domain-containing protein [Phycisphaerae bacterium]
MRKPAALVTVCGAALMGLGLLGCSDPSEKLDVSDRDVCLRALRECAAGGSDEAVDRVAAVVAHDDTLLAAEAIRTLGRMDTPHAVEVLCEMASGAREKRGGLRQEAVVQLGRQQTPETLKVLRQVVKMDPDPRVRVGAITSLARQRSLEDVPLLVEVAETDADPLVQARAVGAVERLVQLKFRYNPAGTPEERQEALRRMRSLALTAARAVKTWRDVREQERK